MAGSSIVSNSILPDSPWLCAFLRERRFPVSVRGPVLDAAFLRLIVRRCQELTCFSLPPLPQFSNRPAAHCAGVLASPAPAPFAHRGSCGEIQFREAPCYFPNNHIRFWAGTAGTGKTIKEALSAMMRDPLFPVGIDEFKAKISFHDFVPGETLSPRPNVSVQTASLHHPGGSTGYRLEFEEKAIAYVTDTEHRPGELDKNVIALARDADIMIYDANYTDEEYPNHIGWGHSTWQQAVRLADEANVHELILYHHDPKHTDEILDRISIDAAKLRDRTRTAAEGMLLKL